MMTVELTCMKCIFESTGPLNPSMLPMEFEGDFSVEREVVEGAIYDVTCKNGHSSRIKLGNEKFELLFEWGVNAIIDGYYRESVSSFQASYERFHEFCVRFFSHSNVTVDLFDRAWKNIARQSERQLGAFILQFLNVIGEIPPLLNDGRLSVRNKVVHQGYFPTRSEAIEYGENVRSAINSSIRMIKEKYGPEAFSVYTGWSRADAPVHRGCSVWFVSTILDIREGPNFRDSDFRGGSIESVLQELSRRRSGVS